MACGGVENAGCPSGFQERDDLVDPFVFGKGLCFSQSEEFLNPWERLEMRAGETCDGYFLSVGKISSIADFAGSAVG